MKDAILFVLVGSEPVLGHCDFGFVLFFVAFFLYCLSHLLREGHDLAAYCIPLSWLRLGVCCLRLFGLPLLFIIFSGCSYIYILLFFFNIFSFFSFCFFLFPLYCRGATRSFTTRVLGGFTRTGTTRHRVRVRPKTRRLFRAGYPGTRVPG